MFFCVYLIFCFFSWCPCSYYSAYKVYDELHDRFQALCKAWNLERSKTGVAGEKVRKLKTLMNDAKSLMDVANAEQIKLLIEAKNMKKVVLKVGLNALKVKECSCIIQIVFLQESITEAQSILGGLQKTLLKWTQHAHHIHVIRALTFGGTCYQHSASKYIDKICVRWGRYKSDRLSYM